MEPYKGKVKPYPWVRPGGCRQMGIYLVELAIVIWVFLVLLFATIEFGRLAWIDAALSYTGNQAARYLSSAYLNIGNTATAVSNAQNMIRSMPGLNSANVTVSAAADNSSFTLQSSQTFSSPVARLVNLGSSRRGITINMVLIKQ